MIKTKSQLSHRMREVHGEKLEGTQWKKGCEALAYRVVKDIANIDHPSFIPELSNVSEFSSAEKANQFYTEYYTR